MREPEAVARLRKFASEEIALASRIIEAQDAESIVQHIDRLAAEYPPRDELGDTLPPSPDDLAKALIAPVTSGRVRGIARHWVRTDAPENVRQSLESLATWLDGYHKALGQALAEGDHA